MPRFPTRPALAFLGALLGLAACVPTATVSVPPTATGTAILPPAPTVTPTPVLAPTPTNVPAGWKVLATTHFSFAYPPDWTENSYGHSGTTTYTLWPATVHTPLSVEVQERGGVSPYCGVASPEAQQTTFAGLPMKYLFNPPGVVGDPVRLWFFANAQQTYYLLEAADVGADAATQAQDEAILATFRPDNATPWSC